MNILHKQQVFITERNNEQESRIYRLSNIKGIRNDENLAAKYLSGAYGGIPFLC